MSYCRYLLQSLLGFSTTAIAIINAIVEIPIMIIANTRTTTFANTLSGYNSCIKKLQLKSVIDINSAGHFLYVKMLMLDADQS